MNKKVKFSFGVLIGIILTVSVFYGYLLWLPKDEKEFIRFIEDGFSKEQTTQISLQHIYQFDWDTVCVFGKYAYELNGDLTQKEKVFGSSFVIGDEVLPDPYSAKFKWGFAFLKDKKIIKILDFGIAYVRINGQRYQFYGIHPQHYLKNQGDKPYNCFDKSKAILIATQKPNNLYLGESLK